MPISMPAEMPGRKRLPTMQELDRPWKEADGTRRKRPMTIIQRMDMDGYSSTEYEIGTGTGATTEKWSK